MIGMKDQCFGVEVEMTGLTRRQAAQALANYFGTEPNYVGGGYDKWSVKDPDGKAWSIMSDSSIVTEMKTESGYMHTSDIEYRVEMVTPKLTYAELPKLQECVRQVRHAGAKANSSCGIHVHVDAANHNRQSLKNLIGIMYSKEDILFKALQVNESRASRWCQKVREPMLKQARRLSSDETRDLTQLENIWYEGDNGSADHPPRLSPSAARSCARPTATMNCSPSGSGWCGWDSTARNSSIPVTTCWQIWTVIGRGVSIRTAIQSIKRRKNPEKWRGEAIEDTNRRNRL